jgi:hypothetical protein
MKHPIPSERYELANKLLELALSHTLTRDDTLTAQIMAIELRKSPERYEDCLSWYEVRINPERRQE